MRSPDAPSAPALSRLRPGDEIELVLEKFADRGKSLARLPGEGAGGYVVFVAGAVPGDQVRARVLKRKRRFAEARLLEVLLPSPLRVTPRCEYFGACGGCKWQQVAYAAQLEMKRQQVEDALVHTGGFDLAARSVPVRPTLGMDAEPPGPEERALLGPAQAGQPYFYRNKMEFSFAAQRWLTDDEIASGEAFETDFALGLHVPGRFDKVLDLQACYLQSAWSTRLVNGLRALARAEGWSAYHAREQRGFLRHLVLRTPARTPERMVNLVTSRYDADRMARLADWLRAEFPEATTLVNTVNSGLAQTAFGEAMHVVFGPGVVHDEIGGLRFEIAPNAFFQTNTRQAETLYRIAAEFAALRPDDLVYDLYCGAGTISLYLARHARHVVGVELVEEAVANARANARANGIHNATFAAGDMLRLFTPDFVAAHGHPDVLVVDPPRAGMHPKVVAQLAALRPGRLVYVSCNPQTQARDLALLREASSDAYRITAVQPVDLFPHTHHVESVVALRAETA
ncbi:MAG: 23S rRNA (uracil(1939)-C(5))-methyltransferase RlmD [Rubricoccaceae bacterium]